MLVSQQLHLGARLPIQVVVLIKLVRTQLPQILNQLRQAINRQFHMVPLAIIQPIRILVKRLPIQLQLISAGRSLDNKTRKRNQLHRLLQLNRLLSRHFNQMLVFKVNQVWLTIRWRQLVNLIRMI